MGCLLRSESTAIRSEFRNSWGEKAMITQPSFRSIQKLIAVMILSSGLSACGKAAPESDGVIANVNGEVRKLTADEQKTICATQYCEPNYIFTTGHGRRHHRKPKPKPSVSPVRSPSPVPSPVTSPSPSPSPVPSHEPSPKPSPILSPAPSPVPSHEPSPAPSPIPSAPTVSLRNGSSHVLQFGIGAGPIPPL